MLIQRVLLLLSLEKEIAELGANPVVYVHVSLKESRVLTITLQFQQGRGRPLAPPPKLPKGKVGKVVEKGSEAVAMEAIGLRAHVVLLLRTRCQDLGPGGYLLLATETVHLVGSF